MDALFHTCGADLTGNKSVSFPLQVTVERTDFQTTLTTAWMVLRNIGELAGEWPCGHGKLTFMPVMDEPEQGAGLDCRFLGGERSVRLEIEAGLELVFDFQAHVWQRLEAVASVMDFLRGLGNSIGIDGVRVGLKASGI
ncbi:hypothetical protein EV700_3180 [Fluviicoccus keumensis]|uniref:Uncharacterized protein n=1 Tax=Fluviicoccus keumensis TaxID=1435465 RepID=A0A4Q7YHS7_9GAMM|nr:hypothetical protein [Fluviicoccus keumensis]RZU36967.1 hypothetical protein EV700_3180 [Fluviicoccus keumensis]